MKRLREWMLYQWLVWRAAGGDPRAWRRLEALARLRTRRRIREYRELLALAREFGMEQRVADACLESVLCEVERLTGQPIERRPKLRLVKGSGGTTP